MHNSDKMWILSTGQSNKLEKCLCQTVVRGFTINLYEVLCHLHSLSFMDTFWKYVVIVCIFECTTVIRMYLTNKIMPFWGKLALWEKEHFSCCAEYFQIQSEPKRVGRVRFQFTLLLNWKDFTGWAEKSNRFQFLKKQWFKKSKNRGVTTYRNVALLVKLYDESRPCSCSCSFRVVCSCQIQHLALSKKVKLSQSWLPGGFLLQNF